VGAESEQLMNDTPHINKWLQGLFKPAPQANEAKIKRWLSQKCIGYQVNGGHYLSVYHDQIEMQDGTVKDVWALEDWNATSPYQPLFEQPRVDIPQREEE
jgi:hypothetical protein